MSLVLPEHFVLETLTDQGHWLEHGTYLAEHWERLDDGTYGCGGVGGASPTVIRCIAHHGDHFEHVDGTGRHFRYRIRSLVQDRDGTYRVQHP